jgi:alginate O-acetyltransferase complex protein AlgJ
MKNLMSAFFAILFISSVSLPLIVLIVSPLEKGHNIHEKREKATFSLDVGNIDKYDEVRANFENFFNDNFGFRDYFIRFHGWINWHIFSQANTDRVLVGKNGWFFLGGASTIENVRHQQQFNQRELEHWRDVLVAKRDWLREKGVKYAFVVSPNKHTIYPENLPNHMVQMNPSSCFDQLISYLKNHSDLAVIDLRDKLISSKSLLRNYHKTDHHWNENGAFIAYRETMRYLFSEGDTSHIKKRDYFEETEKIISGQDLALMMGLENQIQETNLMLRPKKRCASSIPFDLNPSRWPTYVPGHEAYARECLREDLRLVFFQDSFGRALQPFFSESFRTSMFIWDYPDYDALNLAVEELKPDVVVEQRVERHLKSMPPRWRISNDLTGPWSYQDSKVAIEGISLNKILLTNENGQSTVGWKKGEKIEVPDWRLEGILSTDGKKISWSDDSFWFR